MTTGEETKGSDTLRAGNQRSDGVQVNVIMLLMLVTGVRPNELPGDLEAGELYQLYIRDFPIQDLYELVMSTQQTDYFLTSEH